MRCVQAQAARVVKNEQTPTMVVSDSVLQVVAEEGGRRCLNSVVLDLQTILRSFDEKTEAECESAQAGADARSAVSLEALAAPTEKPLDSFDCRTSPVSFVEFWFGDGAPNLDRQRPMLFEPVACRLIEIEELE